jgi:hypothetical protein
MTKLSPADHWKRHILEQIKALRFSGELRRLRPKGLASLGRKKMYTFQEWWDDFGRRATSPTYLKWYGEPMDDFKVKVPKTLPPYTEDSDIEKLFAAIENKKTTGAAQCGIAYWYSSHLKLA